MVSRGLRSSIRSLKRPANRPVLSMVCQYRSRHAPVSRVSCSSSSHLMPFFIGEHQCQRGRDNSLSGDSTLPLTSSSPTNARFYRLRCMVRQRCERKHNAGRHIVGQWRRTLILYSGVFPLLSDVATLGSLLQDDFTSYVYLIPVSRVSD
jgi:hypothetical protein